MVASSDLELKADASAEGSRAQSLLS